MELGFVTAVLCGLMNSTTLAADGGMMLYPGFESGG